MSRNDWERGDIKLPAAAVTGVKKAVRDAQNAHFDSVLALAKEAARLAKATPAKERHAKLEAWANNTVRTMGGYGVPRVKSKAHEIAHNIVWNMLREGKLHVPTAADVASWCGERATNRTTTFHLDGNGSITFRGNVVHYSSEGNRGVEQARECPTGKAFFAALAKVKWTRGSGGVLLGNDEYNEESGRDYEGSGGSYKTAEYPADARPQPRSIPLSYSGRW